MADDGMKALVATITPQQKELLKSTFDTMETNPVHNGMGVYARMFQEYPEYKGLFPRFRHVHDSVLFTTGEMNAFALLYINGLRTIIHSLDDESQLMQTVEKIAIMHKKKHVETYHMKNMVPMLIATMKSSGASIDEEGEKAWAQVFNVIAQIIEVMKKQQMKKKP